GQAVVAGASRTGLQIAEANTIFVRRFGALGGDVLDEIALPGDVSDRGSDLVIDQLDRVHVVGTLSLPDQFVGEGALAHAGGLDIVYFRINENGNLDYLTYIGGSGDDFGYAIAAEAFGEDDFCALVAGGTVSSDVIPINQLQDGLAGGSDILLSTICQLSIGDIEIGSGNFTKDVDRQFATAGDRLSFTITVTHDADFDVPMELTDALPEPLELVSFDANGLAGCSVDLVTDTLECGGGFAVPPSGAIIEVFANVPAQLESCPVTVTNRAELSLAGVAVPFDATASVVLSCPIDNDAEICGDGIVNADEECDWNDAATGQGCRFNCTRAICGDGIVDAITNEECDDANTSNTDTCNTACVRIPPDCTSNTSACTGGLVCGKRCALVNEDFCLGLGAFIPGSWCILGSEDVVEYCEPTATCMPAAQATRVFP
ncbi:MAG: DUF4215 domain-containing protein, partial [Pseudomonadota bacterium]